MKNRLRLWQSFVLLTKKKYEEKDNEKEENYQNGKV